LKAESVFVLLSSIWIVWCGAVTTMSGRSELVSPNNRGWLIANSLQRATQLGTPKLPVLELSWRVFGRHRLHALYAEVAELLVQWGYRRRTARVYVPRVLCELLVTNRSPRLEDLTIELLQSVE